MSIVTMGDRRGDTCRVHGRSVDTSRIVVEHRTNGAGTHGMQAYPCNELIVMSGGRALVQRSGEGIQERCFARQGTIWTGPLGFSERATLSAPIDCIHLCLPSELIQRSAIQDFDVDSSRIELAFVGGLHDGFISEVAHAFWNLSKESYHPMDRLYVDGLTAALTAHVIRRYTLDRWKLKSMPRTLDAQRLKRVLDHIDANMSKPLTLEALAAEACLSPFHFSRLFKETTGLSPQRYVTARRIEATKLALAMKQASLSDIALDQGFGSVDTFIRAFRRMTGQTPAQYRSKCKAEAKLVPNL